MNEEEIEYLQPSSRIIWNVGSRNITLMMKENGINVLGDQLLHIRKCPC